MPQPQLVWCDKNIYNDENKELTERLRGICSECSEFVEVDECKRFLGRGVSDPRRFFLITSGALGQDLVPDVHDYQTILSIYVYCGDKARHEAWSASYNKVEYSIKVFFFLFYIILI